TPSGSVIFKDGTTALATNTLSGGSTTYTNSTFSVTNHSITVAYLGDLSFNTNVSATLTQTVNKASSATAVASSANPSVLARRSAAAQSTTPTPSSPSPRTR